VKKETPGSVIELKEDKALEKEICEKTTVDEIPMEIDSDIDKSEDPGGEKEEIIIIEDDAAMSVANDNEKISLTNKNAHDRENSKYNDESFGKDQSENSLPKKEHILGDKGILDYIMELDQLSGSNNSETESIMKSIEDVQSNDDSIKCSRMDEATHMSTDCNSENKKTFEENMSQTNANEEEETACDESVSMSDSAIVQRYEEVYDIADMLESEDVPEISLSFWDEIAFGNKELTDVGHDKDVSLPKEAVSENSNNKNVSEKIEETVKKSDTSENKESGKSDETLVNKDCTDCHSSKISEHSLSEESCYSDEFLIVSRYEEVFESGQISLQAESSDSDKPLVIVSSPENEDQNVVEG